MFENKTLLDADFLKNECNIILGKTASEELVKFKRYYEKTCETINAKHYSRPTYSDIEKYLKYGHYEKGGCRIVSPIHEEEERVYMFKKAMAEQLNYDMLNGVADLINDATMQATSIAPSALAKLKQLGLVQYGLHVG